MKAIVHERYGRPGVLELREIDKPVIERHQVLLRVHASSVNPVEWYGVTGPFFARIGSGLRRPKDTAVGADLAGRVEAVGRDVKKLQPGDEVFGTSGSSWAEYAAAGEDRLARKPANLSFEEAAAVPVAAITALQALRDKGRVQPGQKVLNRHRRKPLVLRVQTGIDSRGDCRRDRRTNDVSRARATPPHRRNDLEVTGP